MKARPIIGLQRTAPCGLAAEAGSFGVWKTSARIIGRCAAAIGIFLSFAGLSNEPYPALPNVFFSTHFVSVKRLADMPSGVRDALSTVLHGQRIAEPTQPYEATDVVSEDELPTRRFIFGGSSAKAWYVYYEHGGIGWHTHVLVLEPDPSGIPRLTGNIAVVHDKVSTLKRLRIESKRYPDRTIAYDL